MENALDSLQHFFDALGKLLDKDPSAVLSLAVLLYVIYLLLRIFERGMSAASARIARYLPWRRKDTPLPPDPATQKLIDISADLIDIVRKATATQEVSRQNETRLIDQNERFEATLAGLSATAVEDKQKLALMVESLNTMSAAIEQLANHTVHIETAEGAGAARATAVVDINRHTDEALTPVREAMQAIPPKLDKINDTLGALPDSISNSFQTRLISERDALQAELKATRDENERLRLQVTQLQALPGIVAAQDERIQTLTAENTRLSAITAPAPLVAPKLPIPPAAPPATSAPSTASSVASVPGSEATL